MPMLLMQIVLLATPWDSRREQVYRGNAGGGGDETR
jgi:hypothetical protein